MPIVHMTGCFEGWGEQRRLKSEYPEGAQCSLEWNHPGHRGDNAPNSLENCVVTYQTHHGLCIEDRERNGYHDSDFYMVVWNPDEGKPESIEYASTRGWCYPCYSSHADATPEVMELYHAWRKKMDRRRHILSRWERRRTLNKLRDEMQLDSRVDVQRLQQAVGDYFFQYHKLLKTKRFRSDFRRSLADQVRRWIADPDSEYRRPLTNKQQNYL